VGADVPWDNDLAHPAEGRCCALGAPAVVDA
jgi:hypothetical protein